MKTALIFGGFGQDGHYLTEILKRDGVVVHRASHNKCPVECWASVSTAIAAITPDYVFHFAAVSSTKHDASKDNQAAVVDGSYNILEAVKRFSPQSKVFLTGSILQFHGSPVDVYSKPSYDSAYSAQRWASVSLGRYYRTLGIQVYIGYLSYHDSPLRTGNHLAPRIAQDAHCVGVTSEYITITDPEDRKEWNYAGDMMEAVWAQVNGPCFEAVLGSGVSESIGDYARACLDSIGKRTVNGPIWVSFTREYSTNRMTGDRRFAHHFKTTLPELAEMMVRA